MKLTADYIGSKKHIHFFGDLNSGVARAILAYAQKHAIPASTGSLPFEKKISDIFIVNAKSPSNLVHGVPEASINYVFTAHTANVRKIGQGIIEAHPKYKVIYLDSDTKDIDIIEKIVWFTMVKGSENSIHIRTEHKDEDLKHREVLVRGKQKNRFRKRFIFLLFAFSQIAFLLPLIASAMFLYGSYISFKKNETKPTNTYLLLSQKTIFISKSLYVISKPLCSFLYLDSHINNVVDSLEIVQGIISKTLVGIQNGSELIRLVTKQSNLEDDSQLIDLRVSSLISQTKQLHKDVDNLSIKLEGMPFVSEKVRNEIQNRSKTLKQLQDVLVLLPTILAKETERNMIIFFYNNMELRPGGGFLGSYALVNIKNYHISPITIFDVYDADGQLKEHIAPPEAIKKYLNQPHWFLRDSNFSPDFAKNTEMAEYFLNKELPDHKRVDGFVGITTSAVASILMSFPPMYLADFDVTINSDNFIVKSQEEIESSKSSGSKSKKNYLSGVTRNLLLNADKVSAPTLLKTILENLSEKQIVIHDKNKAINNLVGLNEWGGSQQIPNCLNNRPCHVNYVSAIDANLGVNKTNYYLTRQIRVTSSVTDTNTLKTEYLVVFNNQSRLQEFPGGTYKNFFRLYSPSNIENVRVYLNGKQSNNWSSKIEGDFTITGQYLTVPVAGSTTLRITYTQPITSGSDTYQLVVQKQIGSINNEMSIVIDNSKSVRKIIPFNFPAVEKDGQLLYNSNLTSDKVFIMSF